MPRRTNTFQEVVAIIHDHMADGATVEESAMLVNRATKRKREVDVVIRAEQATHEVLVGVEATKGERMASVEWVERMIGKHQNLPTDKLVLISESGFRPQAREAADAAGVATFAPEDLAGDDPSYRVVNALRSIWPKSIALTPKEVRLRIKVPDGREGWYRPPSDLMLFLDDESYFATLDEALKQWLPANLKRIAEQVGMADIEEDMERHFILEVGPPWTVGVRGIKHQLCFRWEGGEWPDQLQPIEVLFLGGEATIHVSEVQLKHQRLGDVRYAYGEGQLSGQDALFVITENEERGRLTIRTRAKSAAREDEPSK
jgi:hypothetical protein